MIVEHALLNVTEGNSELFEKSFEKAQSIISGMSGYISHQLLKCTEKDNTYLLLVNWRTKADHEIGFRKSKEYLEWKALLHHFYKPFPTVMYFQEVDFGK